MKYAMTLKLFPGLNPLFKRGQVKVQQEWHTFDHFRAILPGTLQTDPRLNLIYLVNMVFSVSPQGTTEQLIFNFLCTHTSLMVRKAVLRHRQVNLFTNY